MMIIRHAPGNTPFVDLGVGRPVPVGTYRAWSRRYRRQIPSEQVAETFDDQTVSFLVRAGFATRVSGARTVMRPSGQALGLTVDGVIWVAELLERAEHCDFGGPATLMTTTYAEVVACEGTLRTVLTQAQLLDQYGNPGIELRAHLEEMSKGFRETFEPHGVSSGDVVLPWDVMEALASGEDDHRLPFVMAGMSLEELRETTYLPAGSLHGYGRRFEFAVRQGYITQTGRPTIGGRLRAAAWLRAARRTA